MSMTPGELESVVRQGAMNLMLCEELGKLREQIFDAQAEIVRLQAALKPFAGLLDRSWDDKNAAIANVRAGGMASELQAISLEDVLRAHDLLFGFGSENRAETNSQPIPQPNMSE